jgi:ceramide glucosyltransferase
MLSLTLAAFAAATTAGQLISTGLVVRRCAEATPARLPDDDLPFITLLRPVCGLDPFAAETLASSFAQDYPRYEVIFCVARADDPVVPLVTALIAAHPHLPARLLIGESRVTANPKLNNLHKGWVTSAAEWVAMADSNLLLPPDYLQTLVATWRYDSGLVSSPPVGLCPDGLAASIECAFLNGNQARLQLSADRLGMGFAQGKTLFWRRDILERAGGLRALGDDLAEDACATKLVRGRGRSVTLTPLPFPQPIGKRSMRAVWDRQLRWSRVRRDGFPHLFLAEVLNTPVLPALAVWGCFGATMAVALLGLLYAAEAAMLWRCKWPHGPLDLAAMPIRDILILPLWLATFASRGFHWRGTEMAPSADPGTGRSAMPAE